MKLTETTPKPVERTFDLTGLTLAQAQIIRYAVGAILPENVVPNCTEVKDPADFHKHNTQLFNDLDEML